MKYTSLLLLVILCSCSSKTKIIKSWKAPDTKAVAADTYKKILVSALVKDEDTRQYVEDRIVKRNAAFFPAYKVFTTKEIMADRERCQKLLKDQGYDAIIALQLIKSDTQNTFVPGTYNGNYWGYHVYYYPGFYEPGFYRENTNYIIQTSVFSLTEDKLLWSGLTNTVDPKSMEKTVDEVLNEVRSQLIKDKIIKK